jgi:hypothetical protein
MTNDFQDDHLFDYLFPQNPCPELESGLPFTDRLDDFQGFNHGNSSCQSGGFNDFSPGTDPAYSGEHLYQDSLMEPFSPPSSQSSPLSAYFFGSPMSPDEHGNFTSPQSSVGTLDLPDFSLFFAPLENPFVSDWHEGKLSPSLIRRYPKHSILNPHVHYSTPPPETKVAPVGGTTPSTEHKLHNPPPRQRIRRLPIADAKKRKRDRLTRYRCEVCAEGMFFFDSHDPQH